MATTAMAGGRFIPLKPEEHTLIHGKKFMGLGGGKDPIRLANEKRDFFSLRQKYAMLPPTRSVKKQADEKETPLAQEPALSPQKELSHIWPVDENVSSRISSHFGYRTHPVTGKYSFHEGLDIAAAQGAAVLASEDGKVEDIGMHQNLGHYVKVSHRDGTYSLYGHLSKSVTQEGRRVRKGQKIGEVGSTGRSTGPHLDYSLRRDGKPMDPLKYLKRSDSKQIAQKILKKGN